MLLSKKESTSMTIYLYKKTHNKTGLQYLGKTTSIEPHKYKGSGKRWCHHIKKHGYDVTTEILKECKNKEELREWGRYYSELWDVVNDANWANLKPEEGDGGKTVSGEDHPMKNPEYRAKIMGDNHYSKRPGYKWKLVGENHPSKNIEKRPRYQTGKDHHAVDNNTYTFYHETGIVEHCTPSELRQKYSISIAVHRVVYGELKSYKGWRMTKEKQPHAFKGVPKTPEHKEALKIAKMNQKKPVTEEEQEESSMKLSFDRNELIKNLLSSKK
jgi:hypothetical protein